MPPSTTDQARWFASEVQPHERALRAYVRNRFPDLSDVDDLVQEGYLRLLRARQMGPIASAKAYLFTTVTNVALTIFRRPKIFAGRDVTDFPAASVPDERADVTETISRKQEIALLLDAVDALPARCREIFILRKLQGIPQREVAARLGLSEQTVQVQVGRGARKCADYLRCRGLTGAADPEPEAISRE